MGTILTVLKYDFRRFLRDWLMVTFSVFMLVLYVVVALFVPSDIRPTWDIAVTEAAAEPILAVIEKDLEGSSGQIKLERYATEEEMKAAFLDGADHFVGIAMQADAKAALARGERPKARIYVDETAPPATQKTARAIGAMIATAAFYPDMVKPPGEEQTLGPKIEETTFKERTRSLMAVMILIMEMLALGSLLSREISSGVVHAILTTTVSLPRYFGSKMAFGVTLAFVQAGALAAFTGALNPNPPVILGLLLLGSIMFTAAGIIAGTRGRHLMEVLMWGMVFMLPSIVPGFTAMMPGSQPLLVQLIPSYPLIQGILTAGHDAPLVSSGVFLLWAGGWAAALSLLAYAALRRRVK